MAYVPDSDSEDEEGVIKPPKCPYDEYTCEGRRLAQRRLYKEAFITFNKALELQPGDEPSLIARSKCLLQLGENDKAYDDAEAALAINPKDVRAIYQKAEALFLMGNFEFALVFYQRGLKLRPDMNMFRLGVQKAQEAIRSAVGVYTRIKLTSKQTESLRELQSKKLKTRMFGDGPKSAIMPSPFHISPTSSMLAVSGLKHEKQEERELLGLLSRDKGFCRTLAKNDHLMDIDAERGQQVTDLANEIVQFLSIRQEFWRQQKPVNPVLKKSEIVSRVHLKFRPKGGINANLPQILSRVRAKLKIIEHAEKHKQWEIVLQESHDIQHLLLPVKFTIWPQKADVLCAAYCAMGKACVELNLLEVGLNCHLKGLEIASTRNLPMAKDVALEYLGSTYVCLKMYDKAIQVWRQWLPRCASPVLRTWLLHELGQCHLELGEIEDAKECGLNAIESATSADDKNWIINAAILVTRCEVKMGNFRNGSIMMERVVELAQKLNYDPSIQEILQQIKDKVCQLVTEANMTWEDIEVPLFDIAFEERVGLFPKELKVYLQNLLRKDVKEQKKQSPKILQQPTQVSKESSKGITDKESVYESKTDYTTVTQEPAEEKNDFEETKPLEEVEA